MVSNEDFTKNVGVRIRRLRLERGMTQEELACKMDMEGTSIGRIENGKRGLRFYTIYRFAAAFELSLEEFMKDLL